MSFFLMSRRPPRSTRTDTLFPYTTLFRSIAYRTAARGSQSTLRDLPRNRGSIRTSTRLAHANYFPEDLMQIQFSAARPDADFVVLPVEKDGLARTAFGDLDTSAERVLLAAAKAGRHQSAGMSAQEIGSAHV